MKTEELLNQIQILYCKIIGQGKLHLPVCLQAEGDI